MNDAHVGDVKMQNRVVQVQKDGVIQPHVLCQTKQLEMQTELQPNVHHRMP